MASFKRLSMILMTSTACAALAGCDGADSVASPGPGSVVIVTPTPSPTPTPTPTGTPTPAAITAAEFAAVTTVNGLSVTADEQLAIVNAGTNNVVSGFGALNGVLPTANVTAQNGTAVNPATLNPAGTSFFVPAAFLGAINGTGDTSFQNWTCDSSSATFNSPTRPCTAVPATISTATAAAAVCPAGTTDDGLSAPIPPAAGNFRLCRLPTVITTSTTLTNIPGVVYRFRGQTEVGVDVGATGADTGITLTINPGVVLAADSTEASNDLILVNRGSRINAVGTVSQPIIFTSQQNLVVNGVSDATQGQWGGIILLGRAPTGVCRTGTGPNNAAGSSTTCENPIEGVTGRFYGGTNVADNSGNFQYVQIRFTGIAISDGNELQGLTLGGTGNGTTIDHVQSHNSADDGIEIFGGTTNLRYLVMTGWDDDGFDIDNGYRGLAQFIIAAEKSNGATADSFSTEIDSNGAEDLLPRTWARYANFTFIQNPATPNPVAAIRLRGGADATFVNGIVRAPAGVACMNIIAGEVSAADRSTVRAANSAIQDNGPPVINSVYFDCQGR